MYRATEMYLEDKPKVDFQDMALEYEGSICTKGDFNVIGGLSGQRFDANVDVDEVGKIYVRFLVSEQTTGSKTSVSNN